MAGLGRGGSEGQGRGLRSRPGAAAAAAASSWPNLARRAATLLAGACPLCWQDDDATLVQRRRSTPFAVRPQTRLPGSRLGHIAR